MARPQDSLTPDPQAPERLTPQSLSHSLRSGALPTRKPTRFKLEPNVQTRAEMATALGLLELPAFRLVGEITPTGKHDFTLTAHLTAKVVQPCSVTLEPVPATLEEDVVRHFIADWTEPDAEEIEMSEDDTSEPLPEVIDLGDVAMEALSLALPLYPRAAGAELGQVSVAPPGAEPIREDDLKPFAGLAALKDKLTGGNGAE